MTIEEMEEPEGETEASFAPSEEALEFVRELKARGPEVNDGLPRIAVVRQIRRTKPHDTEKWCIVRVGDSTGRQWDVCIRNKCPAAVTEYLYVAYGYFAPLDKRFEARNYGYCIRKRFTLEKGGEPTWWMRQMPEKKYYKQNPGALIPLSQLPELSFGMTENELAERFGLVPHSELSVRLNAVKSEELKEKRELQKEREREQRHQSAVNKERRLYEQIHFVSPQPEFVKDVSIVNIRKRPELIDLWKNSEFEVYERETGVKIAIYSHPEADPSRPIWVCLDGKRFSIDDHNMFSMTLRQLHVDQNLWTSGQSVVLYGILVGPNLRRGKYDGWDHWEYHVYDIYDINEGDYYEPWERYDFCRSNQLQHVKVEREALCVFREYGTLEELQELARGGNANCRPRKGVVCRDLDDRENVFKITNRYWEEWMAQCREKGR